MSDWKTFRIERGHHVSEPMSIGFRLGGYPYKESRKVMFGNNCQYVMDGPNQLDINKLWGYSQWNHMRNSFRLGWRWNEKKSVIEVIPFTTFNGSDTRFEASVLFETKPEVSFESAIIINQDRCHYEAGENRITHFFDGRLSWPRFGYFLRPYFGGDTIAPHNMDIYLK